MQNETSFLILSLQTASDTKNVSCLVPFAIESECCFVIAMVPCLPLEGKVAAEG